MSLATFETSALLVKMMLDHLIIDQRGRHPEGLADFFTLEMAMTL